MDKVRIVRKIMREIYSYDDARELEGAGGVKSERW